MIDGFWTLQIQRPELAGGGVAIFVNGKVFGGDNGFTWIGTYEIHGGLAKARLVVHNFDPSIESVFGIKGDYELHLSGTVQGDTVTGTALIANQPQKSLGMKLTKRANL